MRVLVTGAAGFLGSHLTPALRTAGHEVIGLDLEPYAGADVFVRHDLREPLAWPASLTFDVVVHLASSVGGFLHNAETEGLENNELTLIRGVTDLCRQVNCRRVIYASSICVFDSASTVETEAVTRRDQKTPYGRAKALGEAELTRLVPEAIMARFTNLFGAHQTGKANKPFGTSHVIPDLLRKIAHEPVLDILGDGRQTRNFLHVLDAVSFILTVLETPARGYFNVRSDLHVSIGELAQELLRFAGKERPVRYHPEYLKYEPTPLAPFDVAPLRELGWVPQIKTLQQGLTV